MMPICHFDIPAKDFQKLKEFYGGVFGWTFEKHEGSGEHWTIRFASDPHSRPMTGAVVERSAPMQPIGCHFGVPSVDEAASKILTLGGTVFVPKTAVPGKGYYACCLDPENNYFIIWESDEGAK